MSQWGVVFTKPASEQLAALAIIEAGFRSYCPLQRVMLWDRCSHRKAPALRALFPRYVFAEIEDGRFLGIVTARGVVDMIRNSYGLPATLSEEIIEDLRDRERRQEFDYVPSRKADLQFEPGDQVRVGGSEWGGIVGKLISLDGEQRATVLLDMLGRSDVRTRVEVKNLSAAG
jgi:transcription antitermination factor NusG